jgi:hypothetical protein
LAFAADIVLGKEGVLSVGGLMGALAIFTGFLLVSLGNDPENHVPVLLHPLEDSENRDAEQEEGVSMEYRQID